MPDRQRPDDLAETVRALRRARAWSQEQLAAAADLSLRTVQRVEQGEACAPETLQALAGALDVAAADLAARAHSRRADARRILGLGPGAAALAGALLVAPAAAFIAANVGEYELGVGWARMLFPRGVMGDVLGSPFVLLGGLVLALALNLAHAFDLHARRAEGGLRIEGVTLRVHIAGAATVAAGLACLGVLLAYVTFENLGHLAAAIAGASN